MSRSLEKMKTQRERGYTMSRKQHFFSFPEQITGNLVKSKLRVAEEYVHILPMNTEVIVEAVRIRLLDANQ